MQWAARAVPAQGHGFAALQVDRTGTAGIDYLPVHLCLFRPWLLSKGTGSDGHGAEQPAAPCPVASAFAATPVRAASPSSTAVASSIPTASTTHASTSPVTATATSGAAVATVATSSASSTASLLLHGRLHRSHRFVRPRNQRWDVRRWRQWRRVCAMLSRE